MRPNQGFIQSLKPKIVYGGHYSQVGSQSLVTFTQSGTAVVKKDVAAWVLCVGAGSGGALSTIYGAGGGGGGQVIEYTSFTLSAGTYSVIVGTGGAGAQVDGIYGYQGYDTTFTQTSGGSVYVGASGSPGGSYAAIRNPTQYSGQISGSGLSASTYRLRISSGGSGDQQAGLSGGNGGIGKTSSITGTNIVYGSGGGAGAYVTWDSIHDGPGIGASGAGNGGDASVLVYPHDGATWSAGGNALPNRGGGGGGAAYVDDGGHTYVTKPSGAGGSGVFIIRYTEF